LNAVWLIEVIKFVAILCAVVIGVFCVAVILSILFGKTAWLRMPEETPQQKARRDAVHLRTDLRAKALALGALGNSFLGVPLGLMITALSKLRSTSRNNSNEPSDQ
jgi:uncharacterized iron-regulated membrane protein